MTVKEQIKEEIEKLPEDMLSEVFDFIQFLETKKENILLANLYQNLSESTFDKVWNNEEDAVYDDL